MIVSASYRTDIPAFYGTWFRNRLDAGFCRVVNPYGGQVHTIPLTPETVDGFVFWTKNAGPFLDVLDEVAARGHPFVVQYTVNDYPRALESSVTDWRRSVSHLRRIRAAFGPRAAVWRYDPVLLTSLTPGEWHLATFRRLARALEGAVDEAVISFAQIYRKTRRNLDRAAARHGFAWRDPEREEKRALAAGMAAIAAEHGMALTVCSQADLIPPGGAPASCVDARRLSDVAGRPVAARRRGNRPDCACDESRDIGAYDTCPHGCVYCYAVRSRTLARRHYRAHDPESPFLLPPREGSRADDGGRPGASADQG